MDNKMSVRGRDLVSLIDSMLKVIPEDEGVLRGQLGSAKSSAAFASPELMPQYWNQACDALIDMCTADRNPDNCTWMGEVMSLWNGEAGPPLLEAVVHDCIDTREQEDA